ncbi:hypothetical protein EYC80_009090 [Monilinia laxa]|uniref:Uncharacterized protein n=1 Tax=Monilinia laxa TaxID=61186 RepID=A0A5N6K2D3_MONLA|nr:hypothetical protein EYC80_009090 [Monilinia laxa]
MAEIWTTILGHTVHLNDDVVSHQQMTNPTREYVAMAFFGSSQQARDSYVARPVAKANANRRMNDAERAESVKGEINNGDLGN